MIRTHIEPWHPPLPNTGAGNPDFARIPEEHRRLMIELSSRPHLRGRPSEISRIVELVTGVKYSRQMVDKKTATYYVWGLCPICVELRGDAVPQWLEQDHDHAFEGGPRGPGKRDPLYPDHNCRKLGPMEKQLHLRETELLWKYMEKWRKGRDLQSLPPELLTLVA